MNEDALYELARMMTGKPQVLTEYATKRWLVDQGMAELNPAGTGIIPTEKGELVWREMVAAAEEHI